MLEQPAEGHRGRGGGGPQVVGAEVAALPPERPPLALQRPDQGGDLGAVGRGFEKDRKVMSRHDENVRVVPDVLLPEGEPMDDSPTARALLALEVVQGSPGITADRLADKLGVSERAARRYVAILREAGIPIESVRGPYGGYRLGRGLRLPPLMFSATEALGLVMAVLDGHHAASDPTDPVGSALGKIMRALPEPVAAQAEALRRSTARRPTGPPYAPTRGPRPPLVQASRSAAGSGSGTAPRPARNGPPRSTRGRSWSATAGGTSCASALLRRPPGLPGRPHPRRGGPRCRLRQARRPRPGRRARGAPRGRLGVRRRRADRRAPRGGGASIPRVLGRLEEVDDRTTRLVGSTSNPTGTPSSRACRRRSGWSALRRSRSASPPWPSAWRRPASESVVVQHAEEVALRVAEHHEVGVLGIGPVGHPLGAQPDQPLDLGLLPSGPDVARSRWVASPYRPRCGPPPGGSSTSGTCGCGG